MPETIQPIAAPEAAVPIAAPMPETIQPIAAPEAAVKAPLPDVIQPVTKPTTGGNTRSNRRSYLRRSRKIRSHH